MPSAPVTPNVTTCTDEGGSGTFTETASDLLVYPSG